MATVFVPGDPLIKLALGTGKYAKAQLSLQPFEAVAKALRGLPEDISKKYQAQALKKASKPGRDALRNEVSKLGQVTGNLLASVSEVTRKYTNNKQRLPVVVVVIGFRRPTNAPSQKMATPAFTGGGVLKGPNRAYHSHLIEFGTKDRTPGISTRRTVNRRRVVLGGRVRTVGDRVAEETGRSRRIMSSGFNPNNPGDESRKGKRRAFKGRGQYPIDFIATGTVRGGPALRPLGKAFEASESRMKSVLDAELRKAFQKAVLAQAAKFKQIGTVSP